MAFYAIMLDEHLKASPSHWPLVAKNDTLMDARCRRQYQTIIVNLPRNRHDAYFVEPKSLTYAPDGTSHAGGIYKITTIAGD